MKLLLDTHILLWSAMEPERLSQRVAKALTSPDNELWLSAASVWELVLLARKKRVEFDAGVAQWIRASIERLKLNEAPITFEIALESEATALTHHDPGDKFLAATAKVLGLTLVTSDERLVSAHGISVLENR